jgi:SnoaL-like domain
MPSAQTLERFIARVEAGAHVEAIAEFYASNASMQENQREPRRGRELLMQGEAAVLARGKGVASTCVRPVLVNGDTVVVRWRFRFEWLDGTITELEELAWQRWQGELIAEEQFFYDPAQLKPRQPA